MADQRYLWLLPYTVDESIVTKLASVKSDAL
jgi:hypothetical protein